MIALDFTMSARRADYKLIIINSFPINCYLVDILIWLIYPKDCGSQKLHTKY